MSYVTVNKYLRQKMVDLTNKLEDLRGIEGDEVDELRRQLRDATEEFLEDVLRRLEDAGAAS